MAENKPYIFMILRSYRAHSQMLKSEVQRSLVNELNNDFNVDIAYDFSDQAINRFTFLNSMKITNSYRAMITQVPPKKFPGDECLDEEQKLRVRYKPSLDLLRGVKQIRPDMPIIAYTAAENNSLIKKIFTEGEIIKDIVFKTSVDNWLQEAKEIKEKLNSYIKRN